MESIILAGGLGTRLQKTVPHLPKVLAPIQGIPFLTLLIEQLQMSPIFSKIILSLGFKSDQIAEHLSSHSYRIPLTYLIEPQVLGTGGAILYALPQIKSPTFCVLNGDSYSDLSFSDFYQFHQLHHAEISIACHEMDDTRRYGTIEFDGNFRVSQFKEKIDELKKGSISRGIYLFEKQIFDGIPLRQCSLENDLFPIFVKKQMFAYPQSTTFIDIGTEESYHKAQQLLTPWTAK